MKLKQLLIANALLAAVLMVLILGLSHHMIHSSLLPTMQVSKDDSKIINIAGRQRMLTQRMSKLAELVHGGDKKATESLQKDIQLFDSSLQGLMNGNKAEGLRAPPTPEIRAALEVVEKRWQSFRKAAETIIDKPDDHALSLAFIRKHNLDLLKESNAVVQLWANYSGGQVAEMLDTTQSEVSVQMVVGIVAILASGFVSFLLIRRITLPLDALVVAVKRYADCDLREKIPVAHQDEIGSLTQAVNDMGSNLRGVLRTIREEAASLSSASEELSATSSQLASSSEEMSERSRTTAGSTESLNNEVITVGELSRQMSSSAGTVAAAIEQMSASISEVAGNSAEESSVAKRASEEATRTREIISELGGAAEAIGRVVELITNIADQTNLLALNATIEAASAGEAGKGFAVVANEVKELARQTAEATDQISDQIRQIQQRTSDSVDAMENVTETIAKVNQFSHSVSASVEEQSATTREIAETITQMHNMINEVVRSLELTTGGATDILDNVQSLNGDTVQVASAANQTNTSASELSKLATQLQEVVERFRFPATSSSAA